MRQLIRLSAIVATCVFCQHARAELEPPRPRYGAFASAGAGVAVTGGDTGGGAMFGDAGFMVTPSLGALVSFGAISSSTHTQQQDARDTGSEVASTRQMYLTAGGRVYLPGDMWLQLGAGLAVQSRPVEGDETSFAKQPPGTPPPVMPPPATGPAAGSEVMLGFGLTAAYAFRVARVYAGDLDLVVRGGLLLHPEAQAGAVGLYLGMSFD